MANIKVRLPSGELVPMRVPDDWSQDKITEEIHRQFPIEGESSIAQTPFNKEESNPIELTLTKGSEDTGADWRGLAGDAVRMLGSALKGGTGFAFRSPGNIAEIGSELIHHPIKYPRHAAGQILASMGESAKSLANLPHDIFEELADRRITPDWLRTGSIPEDTGVERFFGLEPTKKSDELIRAIPALMGSGSLLRKGFTKGKQALSAPDLKQSLRETQTKVNRATEKSGKTFDIIEKAVEDRGISKVPIHSDIIDTAETFLAKTPANKAMIESARTGDYKALRKLQADLRVKGEKALASKLMAENTMGEEILSTRDQVNESIQNHFENTGNKDLAKDLNKTRNDYRNIQKTYFSTPQLAKVFGKSQKIPHTPLTLLREESTEMKKFMLAHPEVQKALIKALRHEGRMKLAKSATNALGIGTASEVMRKILGGH